MHIESAVILIHENLITVSSEFLELKLVFLLQMNNLCAVILKFKTFNTVCIYIGVCTKLPLKIK